MFHNHVIVWFLAMLLAAAGLVVFVASSAGAMEEKESAPMNLWLGSVEDESLRALGVEFVTDQKELEDLCTAWGISDPLPLINFNTEIGLIITGNGTLLQFANVTVNDAGDLEMSHTESVDLRPGFRWAIGTVKRAGIKTVNGKDLPRHYIVDTAARSDR